ncbi:threonine-phosphate decarboxylase CobD [Calothrix sp. UHCC 0171]|uniref:threonine-phosphate decarboxylase CobD n=1 Tax=Calothrix sp. UHCC 0171 TaxID=3110245 RepID=UPI002B1F7B05|nr:threonine-phosphate decarboxylase CobD [Calothrix sp. UHCC 0171]MEA5571016.1 threonine-phosphate decarboxylase CobD [Calothrix sp. UHCC 0171]
MGKQAHGGNLVWAAALAGCSPSAILDFSASISPLGPPGSVLAAIESQLSNIQHYPDPNYSDLRNTLSHFHQLPSEWIMPGNGSAELLTLAGRDLAGLSTNLGATVLITPAFGDYYRALAAYDAKVLEFSLFSAESLSVLKFQLSAISAQTSGLLLNNPHNPTGRLFRREEILPLLDKFALVVVDEAFMDFLPPDEEQSLLGVVQDYPNLVILRSLTKFYSLAGLRLGYAVASPQRLQRWQSWRDPWSVNCFATAAGVAAIQDQEFQQQTWCWLPLARQQLFDGLAKIPGLTPWKSAANFLLVESEHACEYLQEQLLKKYKILIRDCHSFPELGDRFFRVAVRTTSENQLLLTALQGVVENQE